MNTSLSLNPQYDELVTSLHQIDALLDVATSVDLTELKPETMPNYLWIITTLLHKAKKVCEDLAAIKICSPTEEQNHAN